MYERFYGLHERPFDLTPDPRYMVMTASHREALSNLEYAIDSRKGITLLLGEAGSGKTTVIRTALERQTARVHAVHINNPTLKRDEFIEMLAARFGLTERAGTSKALFLVELEALLRERHEAGATTVLIIDEAQSLSFELLEEVRLLANIETNEQKLLSLVLAGQPELAEQLNQQHLRQLKQRVALRCELQPLTFQDTLAYISRRIRAAGGTGGQVFTKEAIAVLHEHAAGIPRTINVLADNALVAGFATGERPVSSERVRDVCREFHITAAPTPVMERPVATSTLPAATEPSREPALSIASAEPRRDVAEAGHGAVNSEAQTTPALSASVESDAATSADSTKRGEVMFGTFAAKPRRFSFLIRRGTA